MSEAGDGAEAQVEVKNKDKSMAEDPEPGPSVDDNQHSPERESSSADKTAEETRNSGSLDIDSVDESKHTNEGKGGNNDEEQESSENMQVGPDMDSISDDKEGNLVEKAKDEEEKEEAEPTISSDVMGSSANLDEMMDIGTVDQGEQEAQMKEENHQETSSNTVSEHSEADDNLDVKPTASELMPSSSSPSSAGRNGPSPDSMVNGMKVVKLSVSRSNDNQQTPTPPIKSSPSPPLSPPLAKVKDEPVDEEYERALISSASTAEIKDEPDKEDLQIGSVYSVTPSAETLPVPNPSPLHMSCSHCRKSLLKGQTAFQRKGSPALFCSTACLTTSLPTAKGAPKVCSNCQKLIFRPQDIILAPDAKGITKEFCSQSCLSSFNYKKMVLNLRSSSTAAKTPQTQSKCSMCSKVNTSKHEVVLNSTLHKLCSDTCFNRFRSINNLTMAICANCGSYCPSKPVMLKLEEGSKTLCNMNCLGKYKEKTKGNQKCLMCHTSRPFSQMVSNKNSDDSVDLFCSTSCVMAFKVQTVSSSGSRVNCDNCSKNTVPSYHLAMSDTSIRNFCSLPCVMNFQEKFKKSQSQVNTLTKLPVGSSQTQTVALFSQTSQTDLPKLNCFQCNKLITSKPELIQVKDKMVFLCCSDCSIEYKKAHFVTSLCEYCKIEKITREAVRIDNKNCYFCSDGCKLLFRHELSKNWGKHCQSCFYCHSVSKKLVTAQYGGSVEEFCSEDCRSKYTMLFCHVAKCDCCFRKGKLKQSLALLGEVKHFCGIGCLLRFCCARVTAQGEIQKATPDEATPIIGNVMSLASQRAAKPTTPEKPVHQGRTTRSSGSLSIQTEAPKPPPAPQPAPKSLKNKALLCKPLVQNKGVSCRTQTVDVEAQTEDIYPKLMVVPVPVPVYLPVPMNMYSQFAPKPVGLPLPLPVPMFLPVTMDSAERIVETIQEIKEKIPSDPFEAELILMAEMVAEEDDTKQNPETQKQTAAQKETEKREAPAPEDHISNYSDDLDTDDLASFLNNWEDASSDAGVKVPGQADALEKPGLVPDAPASTASELYSEPAAPPTPSPPPGPPALDIEVDFSVEVLERMSRLREQCSRSPSPPPTQRRRQTRGKARDKKGRKSQRFSKAAESASKKNSSNKKVFTEVLKLKSEYGVDAWKRWIQWRQTQPNVQQRRFGSRPLELKEDILRCTTAELSYGLCCFISEVKRPSGEPYSLDSLFYLCLGIQQYLFENGRVENIFMDAFYSKFSSDFTKMLRGFTPIVTPAGYVHSRVEEEFLWECKQLGAYSPIVLLNTLLFFCCKYFGFTSVEQHRLLSFAHVMRCTKTNSDGTKTTFLRFYPPISVNETESDSVPAKKRKEEESKEEILEMMENTENPLRCPVRLYEFYLSKCSESVKQRTNVFYLHPERCCVPNSPLWFSSTPLDDVTMEAMLIRILAVRDLHLRSKTVVKAEKRASKDPPFIPEDEDSFSE